MVFLALSSEFTLCSVIINLLRGVLISPRWSCCSLKKEWLRDRIILEIRFFSSFFLSTRDDFNIKVLQAFVELHEFADLNLVQALRWAEWFAQILSKKISQLHRLCPVHPDLWHHELYPLPLPLFIGSSCGVSACLVKPRRSTVWWRRLPRGTASATPESSSRQVRYKAGHCHVLYIPTQPFVFHHLKIFPFVHS